MRIKKDDFFDDHINVQIKTIILKKKNCAKEKQFLNVNDHYIVDRKKILTLQSTWIYNTCWERYGYSILQQVRISNDDHSKASLQQTD